MDLVATGTVTDIVPSRVTSRVEVRVERVLLGDRDYAGKELFIKTDSGTNGGIVSGDVGFREGASYELYLQREGDGWKTNMCLGTRELMESPEGAASVPEGKSSTGSPTMPETGGPDLATLAMAVGLALAGIGVAYGWRRPRGG